MIEWGLCKGQRSHSKSSRSVIFAALLLHKATIRSNNSNLIEADNSSLEAYMLVSEYNLPVQDNGQSLS